MMCGIVGILRRREGPPPDEGLLRRMLAIIRHRGPDEFGIYLDDRAGIGSARLSIVDLETGQQPIPNEDGSLWIVFNGEIYNHPELREGLERAGHRFRTRSDTEVILHLYEEQGPECLHQFNGQFAIAIWDARRRELFLARDRLGVRPLFYVPLPDGLAFASEIKALLLVPGVEARLDPYALAQAFTFWAPLAPRTAFEGIRELPPGNYLRASEDTLTVTRYWSLTFPAAGEEARLSEKEAAEALRALLADATRLRLRADVPVGSYLSGGLDSTLVAALARQYTPHTLRTFSIAFEARAFDEREYQEAAAEFLGTDHRRTECTNADIGTVFPLVVWHAEAPLLRTAPAPLYLLSRLVRQNGIKVVLTGEGADEFLGGYSIFQEDKVRRFWAANPDSALRPLLLQRLHPYVAGLAQTGDGFLRAFFGQDLCATDRPGYSHLLRWRNGARLRRFFSPALSGLLGDYDPAEEFLSALDGALLHWSPLAQAQYLEVTTFLSPYLLSSQGDRMAMAHSVEGRFPFLDHRVVEFCNRLPPQMKLRGLREKHILRKSAEGLVPPSVWQRRKQPYRAPIAPAFLSRPLDYVEALLSPESVQAAGIFDPQSVLRLVRKCRSGGHISEPEEMALVGIISVQLLYYLFVEQFPPEPVGEIAPLRVYRGKSHFQPQENPDETLHPLCAARDLSRNTL